MALALWAPHEPQGPLGNITDTSCGWLGQGPLISRACEHVADVDSIGQPGPRTLSQEEARCRAGRSYFKIPHTVSKGPECLPSWVSMQT